jgi:hypothetical protein
VRLRHSSSLAGLSVDCTSILESCFPNVKLEIVLNYVHNVFHLSLVFVIRFLKSDGNN